jgi:hypothetical protein
MPDVAVIAPEEEFFSGAGVVAADEGAVFHKDGGTDPGFGFGMGVGGECAGPGDVTVAGGVEGVGFFDKGPASAGMDFAEGEEVLGDVGFGAREMFFGVGKLVHEDEAEVMFGGGEIDFKEARAEAGGGFPTDLAAEAGFIAGAADGVEVFEEEKESGFEEMPIFGAGGEEGAEPKFGAFDLVEVEDGEVALAGGGDVEAENVFNFGYSILDWIEREREFFAEEIVDFVFAFVLARGVEFAEELEELRGFEVEALDGVIGAAAFDGGPVDDGGGGGAERVAHVGLLEDFFGAGAGFGVGEELFGGQLGVLNAIDDVEQAVLDGVGEGEAEIEGPGFFAGASLLDEVIEEGVLAVMGGPNGHVGIPGDAGRGSVPRLSSAPSQIRVPTHLDQNPISSFQARLW